MQPTYVPPEAFAHQLEATVENDIVFLLALIQGVYHQNQRRETRVSCSR
jgi:hypothetical protein